MTYTTYFISIAALVAGVIYLVVGRRPEYAQFRFFRKDAFIACSAANSLLATPYLLNQYQIVDGYSSTLILMLVVAAVLLVGLAIYNVRQSRLMFGLSSTVAQTAVYGMFLPVLVAWLGYQMFFSTVSGMAVSDEYDRVNDPEERFGVSEDELRGEGLFDPDRVNG